MSLRVYLARIKRKLLQKPFLKDKRYPGYWFDQTLSGQKSQVVQIGSNDGKTGDPLYQLLHKNSGWKALFVEPVPYLFDRLKQNYPDKNRFQFENAAISEGDKLTFYWVDPKAKNEVADLPYWFDQLGSFDKSRIAEELDGKLLPYMLSAELECIDLPTLFDRHKVQKIDLIHIDTEGFDWKILSQLDLEKHAPKFIMYEFNHLSEEDLKASHDFLKKDYHVFDVGIDMLAVNRNLGTPLIDQMKQFMKSIPGQ